MKSEEEIERRFKRWSLLFKIWWTAFSFMAVGIVASVLYHIHAVFDK